MRLLQSRDKHSFSHSPQSTSLPSIITRFLDDACPGLQDVCVSPVWCLRLSVASEQAVLLVAAVAGTEREGGRGGWVPDGRSGRCSPRRRERPLNVQPAGLRRFGPQRS
ncbi:unnamed protein product [Merluccius merluccius]